MSDVIVLTSPDDHQFDVYEAQPDGGAKGTIVVIQEIFGVNAHIREVAQGFAAMGYRALAPALFDRVERQVSLGYSGADMMQGVELARGKLQREDALMDLQTTIAAAAMTGPVGVVGYCFGGLLAWLAACQLEQLSCAVSYYGGGVASEMSQTPTVPVMFHFAGEDAHISMADVAVVEKAQPNAPLFVYEADHGFNCNHRASFNEPAAVLALSRTHEFFDAHLG
ncbi:MAG: dienelactone hydrolase family protein [Pseudomonadales bacterium]|jgi:carboxymethylenebutenolidase|tara:strand:+ start:212 stop:883 length:672 start_codon:yes stop_codon:yes gene_type:complete